jgi:hypothetical protein
MYLNIAIGFSLVWVCVAMAGFTAWYTHAAFFVLTAPEAVLALLEIRMNSPRKAQ